MKGDRTGGEIHLSRFLIGNPDASLVYVNDAIVVSWTEHDRKLINVVVLRQRRRKALEGPDAL